MDVVKFLRRNARKLQRRIVLPEKDDKRVQKAAEIIKREKIANVILLGKQDLDKDKIEQYSQMYFELRKHKGLFQEDAKRQLADPLYYAAFMVREGFADAFVAGAVYSTPDVARAAIRCFGVDEHYGIASSSFVIQVPNCSYGEKGIFLFADCGIVPDPSARQLAKIAYCSADLMRDVFGFNPRIAMLSFSTKGSSHNADVEKVRDATRLAKELIKHGVVEGELQADTAIIPEVAKIKDSQSRLKGRANILIFPNLEAGNICYKLVQRLAKARAIGPILQGLNFPCSDLSRGCSVEDIVDVVALTALRVK
jgi:phosphate acetyltransferase